MLGKVICKILTAKGCKVFPQMEELVEVPSKNSMKVQSAHPLMQAPNVVLKSKTTRFLLVKVLFGFSAMS